MHSAFERRTDVATGRRVDDGDAVSRPARAIGAPIAPGLEPRRQPEGESSKLRLEQLGSQVIASSNPAKARDS